MLKNALFIAGLTAITSVHADPRSQRLPHSNAWPLCPSNFRASGTWCCTNAAVLNNSRLVIGATSICYYESGGLVQAVVTAMAQVVV